MTDKKRVRVPDKEKVLNRLAGLCSRSEQCSQDIRDKLAGGELTAGDAAEVMDTLRRMGFVDDRRYARSFATDKVRFAGWGKRKIRMHLMAKHIDAEYIDEALAGIDAAEYKEALLRASRAKGRTLDLNVRENRDKLLRHLLSRGFETALCLKVLEAVGRRLDGRRDE